ncbi:MAG: hypothetical protein WD627_02610, partial [Actinomycetota bacterium]
MGLGPKGESNMHSRAKSWGIAAAAAVVALQAASGALAQDLPEAYGTLPAEIQELYQGVEDTLQAAAYDDFEMPPKPWKWCHSESYQGNPWRVSVTQELERLVEQYKAEGWISDFEM